MAKFILKHKSLIISIAINLVISILILLFYGLFYGQSDDQFFSQNIAKGNYNYTFCSYFIQWISGMLQQIIHPYNAFLFLQLFFNFVSLTTICYVFLSTFGTGKGIMFSLILEAIFSLNFYAHVTFTHTAAALLVAGTLLMIWAYHSNKGIAYQISGIIFILFGSFYRFDIFYSVMAVFAVFIFAYLLSKLRQDGKWQFLGLIKKIFTVKNILVLVSLFAVVFSFQFLSTTIINSYEGLDYYREYNRVRSGAVDYDIPLYDLYKEDYKNIGISENDFQMLRGWFFDDEGYASLETLTEISHLQNKYSFGTVNALKNMVAVELRQILTLSPEGLMLIGFAFASIAVLAFYKKSWIYVASLSAIILALYSYLWITGRCNHRAVLSFLFASVVYLLYSTQFLEKRKFIDSILQIKPKFFISISLLLCVMFTFSMAAINFIQYNNSFNNKSNETYPNLNKCILNSKDKYFVFSGSAFTDIRKATLFKNTHLADDDIFDKCIYYGSAYYAHPCYIEMLNNAGINNLYVDIIDNDNIYLIDNGGIDMLVTYLNEQYGDNASYGYTLVDNIDGFDIYKVITIQ